LSFECLKLEKLTKSANRFWPTPFAIAVRECKSLLAGIWRSCGRSIISHACHTGPKDTPSSIWDIWDISGDCERKWEWEWKWEGKQKRWDSVIKIYNNNISMSQRDIIVAMLTLIFCLYFYNFQRVCCCGLKSHKL